MLSSNMDIVVPFNPFMVFNELESGLKHHSLVSSSDQMDHFREMLAITRQEYEDLVKSDVQKAISLDESAIETLCANYIDHVKAYTQKRR